MAQRNSEYARIEGDLYVTPKWVYETLIEVEAWAAEAWDCAPINATFNFLDSTDPISWIATNPPFKQADQFVRHALYLTEPRDGRVAMLLPLAFNSAKTRRDLFEAAPFKAKYTLTKRIRWENLEQKKAGPSQNHAWFVWDWQYEGRPFLGYLPLGAA